MKEYLYFELVSTGETKTQVWHVHSKSDDFCLGIIKWYALWRQYCFFPTSDTVWSRGCMKQIMDFIRKLMDERKNVQIHT